jgi:hypothetical protein
MRELRAVLAGLEAQPLLTACRVALMSAVMPVSAIRTFYDCAGTDCQEPVSRRSSLPKTMRSI